MSQLAEEADTAHTNPSHQSLTMHRSFAKADVGRTKPLVKGADDDCA